MNSTAPYIVEKFGQAVCDLATGRGDARSRVGVAFYRFWTIPIQDFPDELREDRERITTLLTRLGGDPGYILPNNLSRMKNSTAAEIAQLILSIYLRLLKLNAPASAEVN